MLQSDGTPGFHSPRSGAEQFWRGVFSVQSKFAALAVGLALGVGAIVGTIGVESNGRLLSRLHRDHCRQLAAIVATKATGEFDEGAPALQRFADTIAHTAPLLFVSFMSRTGEPLAVAVSRRQDASALHTAGFTPDATIGVPVFVPASSTAPAYLDVTYPVSRGQAKDKDATGSENTHLQGYVRIGVSLEHTLRDVNASMNMLSGVSILVIAAAIPIGFILVRMLVGPLHELSETMARFAQGDHQARSRVRRTDEIGQLAATYNFMADRLVREREEIVRLNTELEERVQQRTRQLRDLAARDPLTGLYNRRHFNEVLERRFAEAKRYGQELACIMIDLDDFKVVNDRYGHQVGDELLILTTITITTQLRSADVAARFGGDEFIVLLPQSSADQASVLAERIMRKFNESAVEQFPYCPVSLSVGLGCMVDVNTPDPDDLIRAADKALYEAKSKGKNTIAMRRVPA